MNRASTSIVHRISVEKLGPTAAAVGFLVIALNYGPMVWLGVMSISSEPMSGIPGPFTLEWYTALFMMGDGSTPSWPV